MGCALAHETVTCVGRLRGLRWAVRVAMAFVAVVDWWQAVWTCPKPNIITHPQYFTYLFWLPTRKGLLHNNSGVSCVASSICAISPGRHVHPPGPALAAVPPQETVFRGFLLTSLTRFMPTWAAVLASSVGFGVAHLSARDLPVLSALGVLLGFSYVRSRNLLTPIIIHGAWNSGVLTLLFWLTSEGVDVTSMLQVGLVQRGQYRPAYRLQ